ncbi:hypothetical protein C8F04DRAFT_1177471 [Mycena alexandri]|uniref:Uncharacterized protein n=1 Tax=Mycena alexandri TaxID=1745969 RepID=A0AAD6T6R8_9AGAR|nr:hypothetical protein C8F04DRAFT_1177471 [Mycena alexandri]
MSPVKTNKPPKKMFDLYDAADVPDIMPFPDLALVWTSKGQEIAVPKLNAHQRSWIHDVALRDTDFAGLQGKERLAFYNKVKGDALKAKAFQHMARPEDEAEEARLPALIASWKKAHTEKKKKTSKKNDKGKAKGGADGGGDISDQREDADKGQADDGGNVSDGEDQAARTGLLRGYRIAGWNRAIQKVISNKRTAVGEKAKKKDAGGEDEAPALQKLLGLATFTGRDKFRGDRHEEILELAHSLPGANMGGNFRRAEGILFAEEDKAVWDSAAASDEGVDWKERQSLVATGFQAMVSNLNASGKFRPFVAVMLTAWLDEHGEPQLDWVEAIPTGIHIPESFEKQNKRLVGSNLDAMYAWTAQPLKDSVATGSAQHAPTFPLTVEALDETAPKALALTVKTFLITSYEAAFGSHDIPWADIAQNAAEYYDNIRCPVLFTSTGLTELTRAQWDALATTLASTAGEGSSGFFRKAPAVPREEVRRQQEQEEEARRTEEEEARLKQEQAQAEAAEEAHRKEEEAHLKEEEARLKQEQEEAQAAEEARRKEEEAHLEQEQAEARAAEEARRKQSEAEQKARLQQAEEEARRKEEAARLKEEQEAEVRRKQAEAAEETRRKQADEAEQRARGPENGGKKRKAAAQLVPEDAGTERRTSRKRLTPEEAKLERQQKQAAEVATGKKPSYEYVQKSPVKAKAGGSKKRYFLPFTVVSGRTQDVRRT